MHEEAPADDTLAQQLLANPASSGINTKADLVFYVKKHGHGSYLIFAGSLIDAAAFEKLCKEMHKEAEVKTDGAFSYMNTADHGSVVWDKTHFAYAANAPAPGMPGMNNAMEKGETFSRPGGFIPDSLRIFGTEALTLKNSDNLDKDERFASLLKDSSDVHIWINIGQYYTGMDNAMLSMMKVNTLLEDNITALSVNFDNGKITAKAKHYYGDEMNKLLANNKPADVSADVINRIPSSNVAAVFAFNYSPKTLKEILKMTGVDVMADMFLAKVDFSIDEFVKANKGEMLIAVSDIGKSAKMDTMNLGNGKTFIQPSRRPDMKFLFATAVNDKASFEKMITMAWDLSKQFRPGGDNKAGINYKVENNWFAASNSEEYTNKFLAGGNSKLPFVDKITGHPIGMYIDLQKIMLAAGSTFGNEDTAAHKKGLDVALNMWQDVVGKGGDYKDKATSFDFEINLVDKNTNSLKQLNQYIDKMAAIKKESKEDWKKEVITDMNKDSVAAAMPKPKKHK
jgi:hypothetical protein